MDAQATKTCFKCGETKPLTSFYKHPEMADGRINKCKECNKADVRKNRASKLEYYRAYDRERGNRQPPEYDRQYRARFPKKYSAHIKAGNAIRDGKLIRSYSCESCSTESVVTHAHHDDYDKPLDVRWLCPGCHFQWHAKYGEARNAR